MHDQRTPPRPTGAPTRRTLLRAGASAAGAAALGPALSACSPANGTPAGLDFWQWYAPQSGGGYAVSRQNDWFTTLLRDWTAQGGARLDLTYIPVAQYAEGTQLQAAFSADQAPDLFIISPGDFLRYYNGGVLYDLTDALGAQVDDFYSSALSTRTVDGRVYALPMENEPLAMFYDVDAFERAGLSEADIPTTWPDLLAVADRLRTRDRYGLMFETNPNVYQVFCWYPFLWQAGGEVTRGAASAFDSEATVAALRLWQDAVQEGLAPRTTQGGGGGDLVANLASGYVAMQQMVTAGGAFLDEGAPGFRYGMFPLPAPDAGSPALTGMGGWAVCVNRDSPRAREAAEFAVWAVAAGESRDRMVEWAFAAKKTLPARRSVMDAAVAAGLLDGDPLMSFAAFDAVGLPRTDPGSPTTPLGRGEPRFPPEVVKAVMDALQAAMLSGTDPRAAAQRASAQIDSALTGYDGAPMGS
ncbi:ABC transporter substrate-binding protein [Allostreptomyces psammosilenae]|uniref:Multiple sugar transport system substrate-binding protein n=1 Tax=Allostreptomyces psammosilenae TaxID=1892865 RepID=A0A852ZSD7_9ACTN|nr:sugar ABC transporter substrate-binding protein [Allostreptomyces psammosilenae]NYI04735.1 multiple sugar transport system substrate-binding protein [Allostreptomyces psammosilenae]